MKIRLPIIIAALFLLCICDVYAVNKPAPEYTSGGLKRVPDTELGLVYADPDADLSIYDSILLVRAQVAFRKDWQRDKNLHNIYRVTAEDMVRIREDLSVKFNEVFSSQLTAGGNVLVDTPADGVLIVRPAIIDLDISAPSTNRTNRSSSLKESAGEMTLYLELIDSVSGDIIVKAMDLKYDRSKVMPQFNDKFRNTKAAEKILESWADTLVRGLAEAREATSGK
jgi:hypothetical protein